MARTKKSKWKRNREMIREKQEALQVKQTQKALTFPRGNRSKSTMGNHSDDESMDLDDENGVPLDTTAFIETNPTQAGSNIDDEVVESEIRNRCHQGPIETLLRTEDSETLWQQPQVELVSRIEARSKEEPFKVAALYTHSCHLITKHWECDFNDWIPENMRKRTPYSLALLTQLRRLAGHTKGKLAVAYKVLLAEWRERMDDIKDLDLQGKHQFISTAPQAKEGCESSIQENIYGLMIVDITNAVHKILQAKRSERKLAGVGDGKSSKQRRVKNSQMEKKADRAAQKKEQKKKRNEMKRRRLRETKGIAEASGSLAQGNNKFEVLSNQPRISRRARAKLRAPPNFPHAEATKELSGLDKQNYDSMALMIKNMGMNSERPIKRNKLNALVRGGLIRPSTKVTMPSERTNMPTPFAAPDPHADSMPKIIAQTKRLSLPDHNG